MYEHHEIIILWIIWQYLPVFTSSTSPFPHTDVSAPDDFWNYYKKKWAISPCHNVFNCIQYFCQNVILVECCIFFVCGKRLTKLITAITCHVPRDKYIRTIQRSANLGHLQMKSQRGLDTVSDWLNIVVMLYIPYEPFISIRNIRKSSV